MRLILGLAIALTSTACTPEVSDVPETPSLVTNARVVDGDTVTIPTQRIGGKAYRKVRLLGVDALEKRQFCEKPSGQCWPCGRASQDLARGLLKHGPASIRLTRARSYDRLVGTVEVGGKDLGEAEIAAGFAVPAVQYLKNDEDRADRYLAAYEDAQGSHAGAHVGSFIEPSRWRQGERLSCEHGRPNNQDD